MDRVAAAVFTFWIPSEHQPFDTYATKKDAVGALRRHVCSRESIFSRDSGKIRSTLPS
jgi:hypothetical protein